VRQYLEADLGVGYSLFHRQHCGNKMHMVFPKVKLDAKVEQPIQFEGYRNVTCKTYGGSVALLIDMTHLYVHPIYKDH